MTIDVRYTTEATATGGREGRSRSADGELDVGLARPKELGGRGGHGTNPEQLFAAGYAACFLSALEVVARQQKIQLPKEANVTARIGIGPRQAGGFGITANLKVLLTGVERTEAEQLVAKAHEICPYSNATRGNLDVGIEVV